MTNLDDVMVFIQDIPKDGKPGQGRFILSSFLPWSDDRLLTCLLGLSCIALDASAWERADGEVNLCKMLAPTGECELIEPHPPLDEDAPPPAQ